MAQLANFHKYLSNKQLHPVTAYRNTDIETGVDKFINL